MQFECKCITIRKGGLSTFKPYLSVIPNSNERVIDRDITINR